MTGAQSITQSQGGKWHGRYGVAACPVCQPERRSDQTALTVSDTPEGRLLAHCKKSGCSFGDLAAALGLSAGDFTKPDPAEAARRHAEQRAEAEKKARQAMAVWTESQPIGGTVAEAYLRGRGLTCALPETLRFHPACWHISAQRLPALVAVSYTHLDVYKRQRFDGTEITALSPAALRRMRRRMAMVFQDPYSSLDPRYSPVSYTHLDVYKRQPACCPGLSNGS